MLALSPILLAQGHDDAPIRFIGILIFIAIFIFGNVLQWWQKYQTQQRKLEAQRQAEAPVARQGTQRPATRKLYTPALFPKLLTRFAAQSRPASAPRRIVGARPAVPVVRQVRSSPPPVPGAHGAARRPAPPATGRRAPVQAAAQPRPAMAQPAQPTPTASQEVAASPIGSRAPAAPTRADRIRSIFNARSLKQVYILTELLRPPLALRDSTTPEA